MRRLMSVLTVLVMVVGVAAAADQLALPDYTKKPFTKLGDCNGRGPAFHPDWEGTICELFADNPSVSVGANAVYLYKNADGKLKYATWLFIKSEDCGIWRGYNRADGKWVYEQDKRPCEETKKR